ncbi:MAG: acetyl-CoA carboxylase biotin carboxyl carrier protein subunit [Caldiserica bacterium]|nr:acetyl-CoA carboxylase biotin carboxyl carrier protein subunit [Caldisericota bacterium]
MVCLGIGLSQTPSSRAHRISEKEMMAMPDTVASSLWLSLVDMLVVFAVLAFLMFICYGLKFFSRGSRGEVVPVDDADGQFDVAAGDEPASELPMLQSASRTGDDSCQPSAMPAMVDLGPMGTNGARSAGWNGDGLRTATAQARAFRITVNGKTFEVGVEQTAVARPVVRSLGQVAAAPVPAAQTPVIGPPVSQRPVVAPPAPPAVPRPAPSARTTEASNVMKSPLPGKILKVFATPGKAFNRGDALLIIEAMKMENEILAPRDCVVGEVHVEANQSVKTGEPLLRME